MNKKRTRRVRRNFVAAIALAKVLRLAAAPELFLQEDANAAFRQLTIPTKVASECYDGYRDVASWKATVAASRSMKRPDPTKRWWISNTGSPFDLAGRKFLPD